MTHKGLWLLRYSIGAVSEKHVAADTPEKAMDAVRTFEREHEPTPGLRTVHFERVERIGTVMLP